MKILLLLIVFIIKVKSLPLQTEAEEPYVINTKIIGGEDAIPGEFPYQVILVLKRTPPRHDFYFCGGTIFNAKTIITASHCIVSFNSGKPRGLKVIAGQINVKATNSSDGQTRKVVRIIKHSGYSPSSYLNDVALLEIDPPFTFSDFVAPLPLPAKNQTFSSDCVVTGWGTTKSEKRSIPKVLQKVSVPIMADEDCREKYSNLTFQPTDSMICAGSEGRDSCQGDSGGPLSCDGFLAGVVSWGYRCALADFPGVYTEISYFIDWIQEKAMLISSSPNMTDSSYLAPVSPNMTHSSYSVTVSPNGTHSSYSVTVSPNVTINSNNNSLTILPNVTDSNL